MELDAMFEGLVKSGDLAPFRTLVGRLDSHDREHGSDLVRTLRAYFAANANASEAADRLYLHRNSLSYRLSRIAEITTLDLKDHRARLALQLGLLTTERSTDNEDERP